METGFLNPIHDEEHFSSSFYNQGNGLEDSDHMLFGEMIVPEIVDLWSIEDTEVHSQSEEGDTRKEDFQKMLYEWQQLTSMQETEIKRPEEIVIKPVEQAVTEETVSQDTVMFPNGTSTPSLNPPVPSIDELFPLEPAKDPPSADLDKDIWSQYLVESPSQEIKPAKEIFRDQYLVESPSQEIKPAKEIKSEEKRIDIQPEPVFVKSEMADVPLLLNKDLTTLLEEFEATAEKPEPQPCPASPARPSSQTIRDALPPEVINRIKATRENHKKMISVVPVMRSKRTARPATRMQDAAAALSRNKLLKLVTGGSGGETVQLDHDYCTNGELSSGSRSYYVSDCSEYPSQSSTPEYSRKLDSGSIKDSGMESADNSEDDFPIKERRYKPVLTNKLVGKSISVMTEKGIIVSNVSTPVKSNIPMVSVLKKKEPVSVGSGTNKNVDKSDVGLVESIVVDEDILKNIKIEKEEADSNLSAATSERDAIGKKKRKLNLEEYRVRREEREKMRSQESSRANSPCPTPPIQPDSTTTATTTATDGAPKEKPLMLSVEVQTQTCDLIDLTSEPNQEKERSRTDRKDKRHDLKHRSYRSRHASSSSSSSSKDSDRRSHRRKKSSRSNRRHRNSVSRMWSRSRSRSSSRSQSVDTSRSRSRSRDRRRRRRSRSPRRNSRHSNNHWDNRDRWQRCRSPVMRRERPPVPEEKNRQVEERRVIYVGRIEEGTTKADLRMRFQQFGPIVDISVHFRERGDNYGFVTFAHKADAYKAVEHGNDDPTYPHYDLCFGGRRAFCKQRYADLDGLATTIHNQYGPPPPPPQPRSAASFDLLLHEMKNQMRKRSSV